CAFAARNNPKRGFLFVSKVLGKHWPSPPAEMLAAHTALAERLPPAGDRPAVFIGMAETATGLAQGVFEARLKRHGEGSAIYVQTTRYPLAGARMLAFEERHSHAQNLRLHLPESPALHDAFMNARPLVLVDDELSTGNTFLGLIDAYRQANPALERVCAVALTDFMGASGRARFVAEAGVEEVQVISLLSGAFNFEPDPTFRATPPAAAQATVGCRRAFVGDYSARLGTGSLLQMPPALLDRLTVELPAGAPVLVLGCGEFMHPSTVLGHALAQRGHDVRVQSTTRSPILVGADIRCKLTLEDPYGEAIPNYLYNVDPRDYGAVLLCCETPASDALACTLRQLGARPIALRSARHWEFA
ncbi:MAG: phosphoribosyltransferase domain-containing protein, partial [Solirubrobacteraceae bacterium]|nr:phosphoribosyltransferase domain-containing protein [Solirubrobacteraceae bacterium]